MMDVATAMHGAVFRVAGSMIMFSPGISGNCSRAKSAHSLPVTRKMFSAEMSGLIRSAVDWISVRLLCVSATRSCVNCLGRAARLRDQRRSPLPPAMITAVTGLGSFFFMVSSPSAPIHVVVFRRLVTYAENPNLL